MKDIQERLREVADGRGPGQVRALASDAYDEIKKLSGSLQNIREAFDRYDNRFDPFDASDLAQVVGEELGVYLNE